MTSSAPEENEKEDPPTGSFSKQDSEALRHLIRSALPSGVIPSENADEVANRISENLSAELASVRTVLRETHTTFSGPLPPPDTLLVTRRFCLGSRNALSGCGRRNKQLVSKRSRRICKTNRRGKTPVLGSHGLD